MVMAPPYPAETLAKGWRFELDMEKFKRSDTWKLAKSGQVRAALLLLWAEAWQESPCGTLPDDDTLIALTIDMPEATFAKHRAVLRRGWTLATDGRLYHDVITTRVLAMLDKRANDAQRAAARRARTADAPKTPPVLTDASRVTHSEATREFDTKHQAPSTRKRTPPTPKGAGDGLAGFESFWQAWPKSHRKGGKDKCLEVWGDKGLEADAGAIVAHVQAMAATKDWTKEDRQFVPAPVVYLRSRAWTGAELHADELYAGVV